MSNPLSNPQASSWLKRMFTRTRDVLRRMIGVGGRGAKLSNGAVIGLVVCGLLVGGISLAALGREGAAKSEATTAAASASPAAESKATPGKAERKSEKAAAENAQPPTSPLPPNTQTAT